jgi:hypothetical protein
MAMAAMNDAGFINGAFFIILILVRSSDAM